MSVLPRHSSPHGSTSASRSAAGHKRQKAWSAVVVLAFCIPWIWSLLPLPSSAGQMLRVNALDWLQLHWLTSLTLLVLAGQRLLPRNSREETGIPNNSTSNAELQAINNLLQHAGCLSLLGVWQDTKSAGFVYWSDVCYDIHGLERHAPLPTDYIQTFVAPAWRGLVRDSIKNCLRNKTSWCIEIEIIRTDGRIAWMLSRGEVVLDESGQIIGLRGAMQDIDASKRTQLHLQQSELRFERVFELVCTPMAMTLCSDGSFKAVNSAWEELLGYTREECLGRNAQSLGMMSPEHWKHATRGGAKDTNNQEVQFYRRDGTLLTVLYSLRRVSFWDGDCWLVSVLDITARKAEEERLRESEALIALTMSAAALGRWDWDLGTGVISGDAQWRQLNGITADSAPPSMGGRTSRHWSELLPRAKVEALNTTLRQHLDAPAQAPFDFTWRTMDDPPRWLRCTGKVVSFDDRGKALRMLGITQDVTSQREHTQALEQMAHFDSLTGLANRVHLTTRLKECTQLAHQENRQMGVVYIDLDHFKPINDQLGHSLGDQLLVQVAQRLISSLRADDCVARLGGDEFVILLNGLENRAQCEALLERTMQSLSAPYLLGQHTARTTASIGYTLYPEDHSDEDTLLRHADQAMYQAKQAGRNCMRAFDFATERQRLEQQDALLHIRHALEHGEFTLYLQPKVDMVQHRLVGLEGLARWCHPQRGVLSPAEFIPLIENSWLEIPFGEWAVRQAIQTIGQLQRQGMSISVGVNISARQLQQPGFAQWVMRELRHFPSVPARLLDLEITESAALQDITHAAGELEQLRAIGVTVSMDDFGTGYCSLTYLRQLPLDTLKIDQSFVRDMLYDQSNRTIIQGVSSMAASFGYEVIAEGVETEEQCHMLQKLGCTVGQGYFFARPMPVDQLPSWHAQWQATEAIAHSMSVT